ncbi:MAG: GDP-mannose 4,6-dehydratase [Legionellales bacterium]|nr:GDP-mannose 4,6-dehydratase [Legionellales bacterium]
MNVLVTGGAGFIGSHLVEYHLNQNDHVHVIDDLSTGTQENIDLFRDHPNFQFTKADLLIFPEIYEVVGWADRIYHMAAVVGVLRVIQGSERLLASNISATERLLRAAVQSKKNPRVLLASTSEVYSGGQGIPFKEDDQIIIGAGKKSCMPYVVSKIALEYFGMSFFKHHGLPVTSLRFFNTIGPRQRGHYGMVVPRFMQAAVYQEPIVVYGTGRQTRSFCDVRDTVALIDLIASSDHCLGEAINVGKDEETSIIDLAKLIKELAHSDSEIKYMSYLEAYGDDFEDIMYRCPNLTKLHQITGYRYQWDLRATVSDLIARYIQVEAE